MNDAMNEKFLAMNIETNFLKKKKRRSFPRFKFRLHLIEALITLLFLNDGKKNIIMPNVEETKTKTKRTRKNFL